MLNFILPNSCLLYLTSFLIHLSRPRKSRFHPCSYQSNLYRNQWASIAHQFRYSNQYKEHDTEEAKNCPYSYWDQSKMEG